MLRQDIKQAVRPVLFQSDVEEAPYSIGGSLFVIAFEGRCYGLTCWHVLGDGGVNHLFVAQGPVVAKGARPAPISKVARIAATETDLQDIAVVCFSDEIRPDFFGGTAYVIGPKAVGTSDAANRLRVYGYLTEKSSVDYDAASITGGFCDLQFTNLGPTSSDPVLRQALATYAGHNISKLDGISGAPVYDDTEGRLCGMAVRAGLSDNGGASLWYIDVHYIVGVAQAVHRGLPTLSLP
jgi:hypothetical protein